MSTKVQLKCLMETTIQPLLLPLLYLSCTHPCARCVTVVAPIVRPCRAHCASVSRPFECPCCPRCASVLHPLCVRITSIAHPCCVRHGICYVSVMSVVSSVVSVVSSVVGLSCCPSCPLCRPLCPLCRPLWVRRVVRRASVVLSIVLSVVGPSCCLSWVRRGVHRGSAEVSVMHPLYICCASVVRPSLQSSLRLSCVHHRICHHISQLTPIKSRDLRLLLACISQIMMN